MYKIFSQSTLAAALALLAIQSQSVFPRSNVVASASSGEASHLRGRPGFDTLGLGEEEATSANVFGIGSLQSALSTNASEDYHHDHGLDHYPLFQTKNERSEEEYGSNDILLSLALKKVQSDIIGSPPSRKLAEGSHEDDGADHGDAHDMVVHVTYEHIYAIFVFLITATALGIFTSKLGMVSYIFCETTCAFMI